VPESQIRFVSLRDVVAGPLIRNKVVCPFHDDHKPSCHIYHDHFYCFVCHAHGDAITWLMEVESLTYPEAREALETFEPRVHPPDDDGKTLRLALALWNEAKPITGTLAEYYLTGRHIDVTQLPTDVPLRFHPRCRFRGERHPCLLALLADIETDAPAGIKRALANANAMQDIAMEEIRPGRTGNEILASVLSRMKAKGITGTMYSHPIGMNGHAAGPLIGLWDYQDGVVGRGEARVIPSMWFSIELQATTPVPEWGGQPVQMAQEEDMIIDAAGKNRWARQRQDRLFVVRTQQK